MTGSVSMLNVSNGRTKKYSKSDRIAIHRHADEYLKKQAQEFALQEAKSSRVKYGEGPVFKYLKLLAQGLESMFGAINIRPL